jgi:hypothetical protein
MDPIRPIGPLERDLEPVMRVTRSSPDGGRERHGQPERPPQRRTPAPEPEPAQPLPAPGDDHDGPSLIDVKV